jgi:hypothetical protein
MPQKMLNPNTTLWVVPESGVVNPDAPTAAELNAGTNISCAVVRGYTLNPTSSDTDNSASICDTGNVSNRLYDNYEGSLTMFKDAVKTDVASVYNKAFALFKDPDNLVWVYRRLGKRNDVAAATGDTVEGFLFSNDRTQSVDGGDGGPIQFTAPLLPQGHYTGYVDVVAGT